MKQLFLDDIRPGPRGWSVVRSYDDFIQWITENGCPDVISFDHDLAEEHYQDLQAAADGKCSEKTGYHCALWCIENGHIPERVFVHSFNPAGAQRIAQAFEGKTRVAVRPYGAWLIGG